MREIEQEAIRQIGRLPGRQRRQHLARHVLVCVIDELDVFAGLFLVGGDQLVELLVLFRIVALVPPDHEIGGECRRRQRDQQGCGE
jgi:hypothetical protein